MAVQLTVTTNMQTVNLTVQEYTPAPFPEAPEDGNIYGRKDAEWVEVSRNNLNVYSKEEVDALVEYKEYGTIALMLADQANQNLTQDIVVLDASADPDITFPSGETRRQAYYRYLGTTNGTMADYELISAPYGLISGGAIEADIIALQEGKTDKGGYEGTAQDLKNEIDGTVSGYRGTIAIADTPTEDGIYTPTEAGTYTNAGNLVYAPDTTDEGKFVQFIKTGSNWVKHTVSGGAYSKNETDVYRTLMESDILNSNQITTMVGGLPSTIVHKRDGATIRTDTYTFTDNQIVESRELPTGEKVTITTNTLTLTTDIIYYGI